MKKSFSLLLSIGIIFLSRCTTSPSSTPANPCASVTCQNGGSCNSGVCICPVGYTGTYCQTESVGDLLFWTDCTTGNITGYITVYIDTSGVNSQNTITVCYPSVPNCESVYGAFFAPSSTGTYTYKAVANSGGHVWRGSVNITNACQTVYLHL